jgi:flagellar biosynthesis chaperone FliJ
MMARRTVTIDEKIEKAKNAVSRTKEKYDEAIEVLEKLMTKKENLKREELMTTFLNSGKSYEEVMAFLKST